MVRVAVFPGAQCARALWPLRTAGAAPPQSFEGWAAGDSVALVVEGGMAALERSMVCVCGRSHLCRRRAYVPWALAEGRGEEGWRLCGAQARCEHSVRLHPNCHGIPIGTPRLARQQCPSSPLRVTGHCERRERGRGTECGPRDQRCCGAGCGIVGWCAAGPDRSDVSPVAQLLAFQVSNLWPQFVVFRIFHLCVCSGGSGKGFVAAPAPTTGPRVSPAAVALLDALVDASDGAEDSSAGRAAAHQVDGATAASQEAAGLAFALLHRLAAAHPERRLGQTRAAAVGALVRRAMCIYWMNL